MPELAFIFLLGSVLALVAGVLFTLTQLSRYSSTPYRFLQQNLAKIQLYWNDLEGAVGPHGEQPSGREYRRARATYITFTVIAVLLSWLGFVFLLLMWLSIRKLVKPRLETELFRSELAQRDLPVEAVLLQWQELKVFE